MDRFGAQSKMRMTRLAVVLKGEKVSLTMDGVVIASSKDSVTGRVYERIAACVNACEGMDHFADGFKFIEYIKKTDDDIIKDAKRYRWLRSDARLGMWMVMQWVPHLGKYERVKEEHIDDYIDSAMKL